MIRQTLLALAALLFCASALAQGVSVSPTIPLGQIPGTTTNDSANAGNVGEYVSVNGRSSAATVTITIASPAVVTFTSNPFTGTATTGTNWTSPIAFSTTGALPTGLTAGTQYWIIGSSVSGDTFQVATSIANALAGTAINTTGSQSGVQTGSGGIAVTSGNAFDIVAIQLTAGQWLLNGSIGHVAAAGTLITVINGWISQTSATAPNTPNLGAQVISNLAYTAAATQTLPTGLLHVNLASTTTIYLGTRATFTVSTDQAFGFLGALRVR